MTEKTIKHYVLDITEIRKILSEYLLEQYDVILEDTKSQIEIRNSNRTLVDLESITIITEDEEHR